MIVSSVESHLAFPGSGKAWMFVRVETDDGVHGWGEAYTQGDREHIVRDYVDLLGRYLEGRDPFQIRHFVHAMNTGLAVNQGSREFYAALSAIELALWDVVGKCLDQPVHSLMGGRVRDRVRVYANGWEDVRAAERDPDAIAERALAQVERGYTALKFDPFPEPPQQYLDKDQERAAVEVVRRVREAVGPSVDLLIEVHRRLATTSATRVASAMEPLDPYWFEEPVHPADIDGLDRVRSATTIPVVAGESIYGHVRFVQLLERRAVDIINPDVCNVGGMLEILEVAGAARVRGIGVAPHNYNSPTIATAAGLHASLLMPNFVIFEYFPRWIDTAVRLAPTSPLPDEDGCIGAPTGPGWGVDLDVNVLAELSSQVTNFRGKWIARSEDERPGV